MTEWIELYTWADRMGMASWLSLAIAWWLHVRLERVEESCDASSSRS